MVKILLGVMWWQSLLHDTVEIAPDLGAALLLINHVDELVNFLCFSQER